MQIIDSFEYNHTSISVRPNSHRRLKAAVKIARRAGIEWSESEILRRLAKLYLQAWRGRGKKSATARRYNQPVQGARYKRIPWYVDKVLYAVLWERSVHSGESVSRMLDFAIRHHLPQLMEAVLRNPYTRHVRARRNASYWEARYNRRPHRRPELFITYSCKTSENGPHGLEYRQKYEIIPKTGLSPAEILHLLRYAA
ncbi:MAG TPA: hypothetical protein PKW28_00155 [Turneriella sp.]|nr:hypothetical protein [Turneriella sp.]HMY10456.1 hypothetical protein [Turneriella sp.]HNJ64269.1 hypothetical protein [Turneriella sp.]